MIQLDYRDNRPIYEQITDGFQKLILKGGLTPDEQMPSVRTLAMELSTNPNTIQKAYGELERRGYIYTVKGRGSFVCDRGELLEDKKKELKERLEIILREAEELGIKKEELL